MLNKFWLWWLDKLGMGQCCSCLGFFGDDRLIADFGKDVALDQWKCVSCDRTGSP